MDDQRAAGAGGGIRFRKLRIAWSGYSTVDRVIATATFLIIAAPIAGFIVVVLVSLGPIIWPWLLLAFPIIILEMLRQIVVAERWRFSLRDLLIGMTLVAVILGAVVWATK